MGPAPPPSTLRCSPGRTFEMRLKPPSLAGSVWFSLTENRMGFTDGKSYGFPSWKLEWLPLTNSPERALLGEPQLHQKKKDSFSGKAYRKSFQYWI